MSVYIHERFDIPASKTDYDGMFNIAAPKEEIADSKISLQMLTVDQFKSSVFEIDLKKDFHTFELDPFAGSIAGVITGWDDLTDVRLYFRGEKELKEVHFDKSNGHFHITGINPINGPYWLSAEGVENSGFSNQINLNTIPEKHAYVEIPLERDNQWMTVQITAVEHRTGNPVSSAFCTIETVMGVRGLQSEKSTKITDVQGSAVFEILQGRPNKLTITHPKYETYSILITESEQNLIVPLKSKFKGS